MFILQITSTTLATIVRGKLLILFLQLGVFCLLLRAEVFLLYSAERSCCRITFKF